MKSGPQISAIALIKHLEHLSLFRQNFVKIVICNAFPHAQNAPGTPWGTERSQGVQSIISFSQLL